MRTDEFALALIGIAIVGAGAYKLLSSTPSTDSDEDEENTEEETTRPIIKNYMYSPGATVEDGPKTGDQIPDDDSTQSDPDPEPDEDEDPDEDPETEDGDGEGSEEEEEDG